MAKKPVPSSIVLLSGAGRSQGRRNYMEDVDFIFEAVRVTDQRSVGVYGVLDGHGGKECGRYVHLSLLKMLVFFFLFTLKLSYSQVSFQSRTSYIIHQFFFQIISWSSPSYSSLLSQSLIHPFPTLSFPISSSSQPYLQLRKSLLRLQHHWGRVWRVRKLSISPSLTQVLLLFLSLFLSFSVGLVHALPCSLLLSLQHFLSYSLSLSCP